MKINLPALFSLAAYGLSGAALTSLSRSVRCGQSWMAWVPFARLYLLGSLADLHTDNRLTAAADRDAPGYHPSELRHKLLRTGVGSAVTGVISAAFAILYAVFCAIPMAFLLAAILNGEITAGELLTGEFFTDANPLLLAVSIIGTKLLCAALILLLVFGIRFLIAYGTALSRVYLALKIPHAMLWAVISVLIPYVAAILLFVYTRRTEGLGERFGSSERAA